MRILVSGTSGLVGQALVPFLKERGHQIVSLVRGYPTSDSIAWDPASGKFNKRDFEGFDAVIHLAGKNISSGRWTEKVKKEIFLSRCRDTWLLSEILHRLEKPPKTFVCASAVGYYGDRGNEVVTESASAGSGFLADVCKKWEEASHCLEVCGTRIVHTRFGAIISPKGGILRKVLPLFKLGLGAIFGDGKQFFPWISLDDVLNSIYHCLTHETIRGPVNIVSPEFETFETFCQKLAKTLHRPLFLRIPSPILTMVFGEIAKEVFLPSTCAKPEKLLQSGYSFAFPELEKALEHMLS